MKSVNLHISIGSIFIMFALTQSQIANAEPVLTTQSQIYIPPTSNLNSSKNTKTTDTVFSSRKVSFIDSINKVKNSEDDKQSINEPTNNQVENYKRNSTTVANPVNVYKEEKSTSAQYTNIDVKNKTQTVNNTPYQYSYPNYTPPIENQNLPQPPLTTQSSNEANQLNDNQNLTANPPFISAPNVNAEQTETNSNTQNTSLQQANLSEKNDTVEKVAESEIEKELSQELPSVKENTQSTQKEPTNNQQGGTQNPKSEEVIEDKTFQEE